tara:strand:+ start:512 stop:820 length:309 start_codon:yes stop_codon:yes gene_type:complete
VTAFSDSPLTRLAIVAIVLLPMLAGCQSVIDNARAQARPFTRQFTPSPHDGRDPTEDPEDKWQDFTREAKAAHVADKDPDPWYRKWFMSAKARQTESHLGVE